VVTLAVVLISAEYAITQVRTRAVLEIADGEQKYADVGRFVSTQLPANAIVLADLHSGSVRYYSGRTTIRYEWLDPEWLDRAMTYLAMSGFEPYLVLENSEVPRFRARFAGQTSVTLVDRPPIASYSRGVFIYSTGKVGGGAPLPIPRTTGCQ
jgi:hypothetical protein